ncbi:hypothetical protein B5G43_02860 [Flavonifractor sp. An92]|uniref:N-acetylmuramoyl-L-alanine amidase n=1 Tax=Flavonifractor sp. An92 TaxID=1965666 RepID=UPI000B36688C|nr:MULTISPECIES: N-acetylmuramoyl-L-alanine amidase [unclassified Flavonifractor]OUN08336.1 hypothetical protein B5G43_02860 [Flavonifractor sp. An92]OUQ22125.1 hypothetical protein B5E80_15105 [Flavonifractor sp. An135]
MSKQIAYIPLSGIDKLEIRVTNCKKSMAQVKQESGADYILNGGMWNSDGSPCPILKARGALLSKVPWGAYGYGWNTGADIRLESNWGLFENFLSCTCLIGPWGPVDRPSYDTAQGGTRGRSAIGIKDNALCLYCTSDGSGDARTPEQLREELVSLGWDSAVMLDGGGSSQCDFKGSKITASRKVHNWICVYLKQAANPPEDKEDNMSKYTVCLDPGHGPGTVNGSPDGSYKEHEFAWDMYGRISKLLEARGVHTICTRTEDAKPSLTERAGVSNRAGATCFVSLHSNAAGNGGWYDAGGLEIYTSAGPMTAPRNILATDLVNAFHAAGVVLRSTPIVHSMDLTVLTKTDAPAVLIEYGFHTSKTDVPLLLSGDYRDKLATATADGVCQWLGVSWADEPPAGETDRTIVQRRFGFADETMDYLEAYQYADALLERLATAD